MMLCRKRNKVAIEKKWPPDYVFLILFLPLGVLNLKLLLL